MVNHNTIEQEELDAMMVYGYVEPPKTFGHSILHDLDFTELVISVNFTGSLLVGSTFDCCDLPWCDFSVAKLPQATFTLCDLSNVSFLNADLREARFDSCNLAGIQWNGADLDRVTFINCTGISRERLDKLTTGQYTIDTDTKETDQ